jgi:hypothetical protein
MCVDSSATKWVYGLATLLRNFAENGVKRKLKRLLIYSFIFETESHYAAHTDLKFKILLP